jgi:carboxyl-terminal processing protease
MRWIKANFWLRIYIGILTLVDRIKGTFDKKITVFFLYMLVMFLVGFQFDEFKTKELFANSKDFYTRIKVFTSILETISRVYVDDREPTELLEDAIKGVLAKLDPHTVYLPSSDFKNWSESFEGYTGIGISFELINGQATIMSVLRPSPAAKAGLMRSDKIIEIDRQPTYGLRKEEISLKLLGHAEMPVTLKVMRSQWQKPQELRLLRKRIRVNSISQVFMFHRGIGYVKLDKFSSSTPRELQRAIDRLEKQGLKHLILDLRGNGGGYLHAAIDVADLFIPGGQKILTTMGRDPGAYQEYHSTTKKTITMYPLIVLIDHGSASAAEIVAGAIQDLDRGLLVGKSSFGKGLVQSQYRFYDGSALLVTTAKYYTPSGRPIQRDFFDKSKEQYYREAYLEHDEVEYEEIVRRNSYKTLTGRTVYAGRGIHPDVWVENKENMLSENVRHLLFSEKRYFYMFAEDFLRRNPKIQNSPGISNFIITNKIFYDFCDLVKKVDPAFPSKDLHKHKDDVKFLIKRELAYLQGGRRERFKVNVNRDLQLQAAIRYFPQAKELLAMSKF